MQAHLIVLLALAYSSWTVLYGVASQSVIFYSHIAANSTVSPLKVLCTVCVHFQESMLSSAQTEKCYLSLVMRVGWFRHKLIPCSGFVAEDKKGFNTPTMSSSLLGGSLKSGCQRRTMCWCGTECTHFWHGGTRWVHNKNNIILV